jgi:hypothetical protein
MLMGRAWPAEAGLSAAVKLQRPQNQAELDACELRSKIRTNYSTRSLRHASVNLAGISNSLVRQLSDQPI